MGLGRETNYRDGQGQRNILQRWVGVETQTIEMGWGRETNYRDGFNPEAVLV